MKKLPNKTRLPPFWLQHNKILRKISLLVLSHPGTMLYLTVYFVYLGNFEFHLLLLEVYSYSDISFTRVALQKFLEGLNLEWAFFLAVKTGQDVLSHTWVPELELQFCFMLTQILKGNGDFSRGWVPVTYVGNLDSIPRPWSQPSLLEYLWRGP